MKRLFYKKSGYCCSLFVSLFFICTMFFGCCNISAGATVSDDDDVVFIHHSCGSNWLSNSLNAALLAKSYINERNDITYGTPVSPDSGRPDSLGGAAGDSTNINHWILWFNDYLSRVKQHGCADGQNRIIMFKSCYPISNISSAGTEPGNPFSGSQTIANYRSVFRHPDGSGNNYSDNGYQYKPLEDIFAENPDTLFIVVTAPPRHYGPSDATNDTQAHNARVFNNWLKNTWLNSYNTSNPDAKNVSVFDWFDFLSYSDDHASHPNRLKQAYGGNSGDSHPNSTANSESTGFFATNQNNFLDTVWNEFVSEMSVFPENNIWNTPVDSLPVHTSSYDFVNTIGRDDNLHPDFGSGTWEKSPIGIPFVEVTGTQTMVPVSFVWSDESDPGPYPIPPDAPIEGGSASDGDRHVIVLDKDNWKLYEIYNASPQPDDSWEAHSGAVFDLKSNELRSDGWTSADAAGLPIYPGLVKYDEVDSGEVKHAIRFTAQLTRNTHTWPARHDASAFSGNQYPPMGQRFRLKSSFDISGYSQQNQVILTALKKYGMILADNGSNWFISGAPDERWDNELLNELKTITGDNFEAVDVSSLIVDPDSGAVNENPQPPNLPVNLSAAANGGSVYNFTSQRNSSKWAAANLIDGITKKTSSGGAWSSGKYPGYSQKIFIELSDTAILTQINFYMKGIEDKTKWPKYVRIYGSEYPDSGFSKIKKIKINKRKNKQKFVMPNTGKAIKYVKIRIKSNHGHKKYVRISEVKIKGVVE
ncbi:MAG: discoidin domain-containing protein [Candidatus Theseobacter exili]|nr:discoidin domain-containing protein [Candidatus Theseobacter exili]